MADMLLWEGKNKRCSVTASFSPYTNTITFIVVYRNADGGYSIVNYTPVLSHGIMLCMDLASGEEDVSYFLENKNYVMKGAPVIYVK